MINKAMILAAGFGKRIQPLTLKHPKPLLKIGKETLLSNTIRFLQSFGIKEVIINIHYLGDQIINYIKKNEFDINIKIVEEKKEILDTGGGVLNAIDYFSNKPFLIINPDTIWNLDYLNDFKTAENLFIKKQSKCLLILVNKDKSFDNSFSGDFNIENDLVSRKNFKDLKYVYTGAQFIKPEVFKNSKEKIFSINKIWDELIKEKTLYGSESKNNFFHVSTLDIYKTLSKKYLNVK